MLDNKKMSRYDVKWAIALFGTAIGAGILFLPIRLGVAGLFPIIILVIMILPMTFLSHRFLARFSVAKEDEPGVTNAAVEAFGKSGGLWVTILYFFSIYPICLVYGVGITNTVESFIENQLGFPDVNRWILAFVLITFMMAVMTKGKEFMLKATNLITYPLIICLLVFSLYLIPYWRPLSEQPIPAAADWWNAIYFSIPVLVFAFSFSPAISEFAVSIKEKYKESDLVEHKISSILFNTTAIITLFTMFFVVSFVMALPPEAMIKAKEANIPILSYFANIHPGLNFVRFVGPLIAFTAILSSFFGTYLGAHEGLLNSILQIQGQTKNHSKKLDVFAAALIYISMIVVAGLNPSILGFMEELGGPFIAMMLYIMPIIAIYKLPSLARFRGKKIQIMYIAITGILAISGILINMI